MIDRRGFLRRLLTGAVALPLAGDVDWERLLWVPKPIIVVPAMPVGRPLTIEMIEAEMRRIMIPMLSEVYFKNDPILAYLRDRGVVPITSAPIAENFTFPVQRRPT